MAQAGSANPVSDGIVIFGGTGDLAQRMLFPSLAFLEAESRLPAQIPIIGVARTEMKDEDFRRLISDVLRKRAPETFANGAADRLLSRTHYQQADASKPRALEPLAARLRDLKVGKPLHYLSVSPSLYKDICIALQTAGLSDHDARIVMEKPIGKSLTTSRAINDQVRLAFSEEHTFRVDHYLGKETVQNIIALRFANSLFEPLWNNVAIDHVQITIAETEGVGSRWPYYDEYGALGDMVQNHLLQLLCLVAMEPPPNLQPESVRDEKVKTLRSLRPITPDDVGRNVVLGAYTSGSVDGAAVASYSNERGAESDTETFVAIKAHIDNWRWAGVPFFLRTGKRLPTRSTEILIQFKGVPHSIFEGESRADLRPNQLLILLQPDEDIVLGLMNQSSGPGLDDMRLESLPLSLSLRKAGRTAPRRRIAYERLILDALNGTSTLFVRRDEIEKAWEWIDGIKSALIDVGQKPHPYAAGEWGPKIADDLIERYFRSWREPGPI